MLKFILFFVALILMEESLHSQKQNAVFDTIALNFLNQNNHFGDSIGVIKYQKDGKELSGKNYYCYKSFSYKTNDSVRIDVINFGRYDSEGRCYMAIIVKNGTQEKISFFGKETYLNDLNNLNNVFIKNDKNINEKYKIEITDLLLRCRRGQLETPKYIHIH